MASVSFINTSLPALFNDSPGFPFLFRPSLKQKRQTSVVQFLAFELLKAQARQGKVGHVRNIRLAFYSYTLLYICALCNCSFQGKKSALVIFYALEKKSSSFLLWFFFYKNGQK